jgi:hypothetical protein
MASLYVCYYYIYDSLDQFKQKEKQVFNDS